jgi:hypothetical protein
MNNATLVDLEQLLQLFGAQSFVLDASFNKEKAINPQNIIENYPEKKLGLQEKVDEIITNHGRLPIISTHKIFTSPQLTPSLTASLSCGHNIHDSFDLNAHASSHRLW